MKVSDIMERHVDYVESNAKVLDVARLIFGRRINGLPVCKGKKVIGFVSETDILFKFHPTMQEFTEDPFSSSNFEQMEEKGQEILNLTAKDIMNKKPITVNADDPVLRADSLMRIEDVGKLPVVDNKGNLVGIVTMGDIFRTLVGKNIPYFENEEYHDWMAKHFSFAMGWEERTNVEIPPLVKLFKDSEAKRILDIGCGSGDYSIALAERGFHVLGLEGSKGMFNEAKDKWRKLPKDIKKNVDFLYGDYTKSLDNIRGKYDAAIFMASSFMHLPNIYMQVLEKLNSVLSKKNGLIILELSNYDKAIKYRNNLRRFVVRESKIASGWKHAYLWFYDPPKKKGDLLMLNVAMFDFDVRTWRFRGMNSVVTTPFTQEDLERLFTAYNFRKVSFSGSKEGEPILKDNFDQKESDWLTVIAKR